MTIGTVVTRVSGSMGSGSKLDPIVNYIDAATLNFTLTNSLILSLGVEYYDTHKKNQNQSFYLLDAGLSYTWNRIRFTLDYNNILNTTDYVNAYYGSLNSYYTEYRIRPASILLQARFKLY